MVRLVLRPDSWRYWVVSAATQSDAEGPPGVGNSYYEVFDETNQLYWRAQNAPGDYQRTIASATFNTSAIAGLTNVLGVNLLVARGKEIAPPDVVGRVALMNGNDGTSIVDCWNALDSSGVELTWAQDTDTGMVGESAYRGTLHSGSYAFTNVAAVASWADIPGVESLEEYGVEYAFLEVDAELSRLDAWPVQSGVDTADVLDTRLTDVAELGAMLALFGAPYETLQLKRGKLVALTNEVFDEAGYFGTSMGWTLPAAISTITWLDPWTVQIDLTYQEEDVRRTYGGVLLSCGNVPVAYAEFRKPLFGELTRRSLPVNVRLRMDKQHLTSVGAFIVLSALLDPNVVGVAGARTLELYDRDPRGEQTAGKLAEGNLGITAVGSFRRLERGLWANSQSLTFAPTVSSGVHIATHLGVKVADELVMVVPLAKPVMVTSRSQLELPRGMLTLRMA